MDNHYITLENREKITISQVVDVDAFDEDNLWANLKDGGIEITGEKLNIERLDLEALYASYRLAGALSSGKAYGFTTGASTRPADPLRVVGPGADFLRRDYILCLFSLQPPYLVVIGGLSPSGAWAVGGGCGGMGGPYDK